MLIYGLVGCLKSLINKLSCDILSSPIKISPPGISQSKQRAKSESLAVVFLDRETIFQNNFRTQKCINRRKTLFLNGKLLRGYLLVYLLAVN